MSARDILRELLTSGDYLEESIIDKIPLPIFISNVEGDYLYCNSAFADFFKLPIRGIVGTNSGIYVNELQRSMIQEMNRRLADHTDIIQYDLSVNNGQGEPRDVVIHKIAVKPNKGQLWIVGTVTDVTELKTLQRYQNTMFKFSQMLLRINQAITNCESIQDLLDKMMLELQIAFEDQECGCILVNHSGRLRMSSQFGYTAEAMRSFEIALEDSYFWRYAMGDLDCVYRINQIDLIEQEDYTKVAKTLEGVEMLSSLSAPITIDGELFGLINFDAPTRDAFTAEQVDFMEYVRKQIAIAIKNMRLYEKTMFLSKHDSLTGLYNRHYFEQQIDAIITTCQKVGEIMHLVVVDADYLKRINDEMGHVQGDQLLQAIAKTLTEVVGKNGLVARFGGDEYIAAVTNCTRDILDRDIKIARNRLMLTTYGVYPSSFSYGVSSLGLDGHNYSQLLRFADEMMYLEKRNRMGERRREEK